MAASKTIDQIIAACPDSFENTADMNEWFSLCYRYAEIEQFPELKESAWIGQCKIDSLDSRRQYRETCLAQCKAIKNITVVTTAPTT